MTNNVLTDLTGIQVLKNLKNATFKDNNINKMDYFDGLPNLQYLDLNNNKLRHIEKSNIGLLPNLRVLILDNNFIKNANPFKKISSLNYLSFENNKLTEMANIEKLADLEFLKEVCFINNPFIKMYCYRLQIIKRMPGLIKIDNIEVSNEEREIIQNEMIGAMGNPINNPMSYNQNPNIINQNQNNMINFIQENLNNNMNNNMNRGYVNNQNNQYSNFNPIIINNIGNNIVNTNTNNNINSIAKFDKNSKEMRVNYLHLNLLNANPRNVESRHLEYPNSTKSITYIGSNNLPKIDVNRMQSINNTFKSQKAVKLNNIPLGNLFKHIGEVISNNSNQHNNIYDRERVNSKNRILFTYIFI